MSYKKLVGWVCVAVLCASCAQSVAGTATEQRIDVSKLDTGPYRTQPHEFGIAELRSTGEALEAWRMAEASPDLASIDPKLVPDAVLALPSSEAASLANVLSLARTNEAIPALRDNGMVAAFALVANDGDASQDGVMVVNTLIRFPDSSSAARAATEWEAADFAVSPDNVAVAIPKYPNAQGHWRPGVPSMSATLAQGDFVMRVIVGNPTPNLGTLVSMVEKVFDEQLRALSQFKPTPIDALAELPWDQDGVLKLTLDVTPNYTADDVLIGVYGPRSAGLELPRSGTLLSELGGDRLASFFESSKIGGTKLVRLRDEQAARAFVTEYTKRNTEIKQSIDGHEQIPSVRCFEMKADVYETRLGLRYECYVRHGRYVAIVSGAEQSDMPQRVAAQYVLLTHGVGAT